MLRITRRQMLKMSVFGGLALTFGMAAKGCVTPKKEVNWAEIPDKEFSIEKFDAWFHAEKLYNEINPNLKSKHIGNYPTFKACVFSDNKATPGIDYSSNYLYAAADGVVTETIDLESLKTGRATGLFVVVRHGEEKPGETSGLFHTQYAHLASFNVHVGQRVSRGDVIGPEAFPQWKIAKLLLTDRHNNYIDPDNYGPNHSYMPYWDGKTDYAISDLSKKVGNQRAIWKTLRVHIKPDARITEAMLVQKQHRPEYQGRTCYWDNFTIMKYLIELYNARPTLFADMPRERFEELKADFYANQPIILTLPLK
jgi:hypothetical protein